MIVKMKHLDLVCVASESESALEKLRQFGAVHLDLSSASGAEVAAARGEAADAEKAVRAILKARESKDYAESLTKIPVEIPEVLKTVAKIDELKSECESLERVIRRYEPYGDFDPVLARELLDRLGDDLKKVVDLPEVLPEQRLSEMQVRLNRLSPPCFPKRPVLPRTTRSA